jgi:hypothetical protein
VAAVALIGLCLALQAAPDTRVFIDTRRATLAWTHSIEKIRWEEDLQVEPGAAEASAVIRVVASRIRGSGAGMEPPEGAVLRDGWYHYVPTLPPRHEVALVRSPYVPDFELCPEAGRCHPMARWLAADGGVTLMTACPSGEGSVTPRPATAPSHPAARPSTAASRP